MMNVTLAPWALANVLDPFGIANAADLHTDWLVGDRILPISINALGFAPLCPPLNAVAYCSRPLHYVRI